MVCRARRGLRRTRKQSSLFVEAKLLTPPKSPSMTRTPFPGILHDCGWEGRLSFPIRLKWWFGLFSTDIGKPLAARQGLFP